MKILVCPLNGPRPVSEFAYGGEVRPSPDPDTCSDGQWSDYVFNRSGSPGLKYEWWCHIASGFWFVVLRDTLRDLVVGTFPADAVRQGLPPVAAASAAGASAAGASAAGASTVGGSTAGVVRGGPDGAL